MHSRVKSTTSLRLGRWPRRAWPRSRRALVSLAVGALLAIAASTPLALARVPLAADNVGPEQQFLTAADVTTALLGSGLNVQDVTAEPVAGSPSGPPATEREALRFVIDPAPSTGVDHPLTGRVLVFADAHALQQKADWFRRSGVTVVQHRNVLVWLDSELDAASLARYRETVAGLR